VCAWVDAFESWRHELARRVDADDIRLAARSGALLIDAAAQRAGDARDRAALAEWAIALDARAVDAGSGVRGDSTTLKAMALDPGARRGRRRATPIATSKCATAPSCRSRSTANARASAAGTSCFPRSASPEPGRHGTFRDVEARLPYIAEMGFDVLYFRPSTRSAARSAKAPTTRSRPGRTTWAARGRSVRKRAATKDILPALGTPEDFATWWPQPRATASRSRSTSRSSARPTTRT
jgi:starch synthase (maltosyl-transferring)